MVTDILLNVLLPLGLVFSFLALGHCVITKRGVAWFLIIVFLGPFGGLVYAAGLKGLLPFKPPTPSSTSDGPTAATATRRCPRCQQLVGVLYDCEDGRKALKLCQMCKSEIELRQADFSLPL